MRKIIWKIARARATFPDLHNSGEHLRVVVELPQRRDRHDLGNGAEAEDFRRPQEAHVPTTTNAPDSPGFIRLILR